MLVERVGHGHLAREAYVHAFVGLGVGVEVPGEHVGRNRLETGVADRARVEPLHLGKAELLVDRPLNPDEIANRGRGRTMDSSNRGG